jgi:pimeloyl-ACP methyl ester carboxylesterase
MRRLRAIITTSYAHRRGDHSPPRITPPGADRRYLVVPGGQSHVIDRGDAGVPLLFLHAPPGGARSCAATLEVLARSRRVVAPDLPGCGASDALAPGSTFDDWITWLVAVADEVGLEAFDVLAQGLAGSFALALAGRLPRRVRRIAIDGLPLMPDPAERASLQRLYAPAITPRRDGSHFHAVFQRLRDEEIQFPWYESRARAARRLAPDLDPERLYLRLVDTLANPRHYGDACRAALSVNPAELAGSVRSPLLVLDVSGDPAYAGARELSRLAPQGLRVAAVPSREDRVRAVLRFMDDS